MNCKKCGAPLTTGQLICSNCDTDNSQFLNQQSENGFQSQNIQSNSYLNSSTQVNNQYDLNSNQYMPQFQNNQSGYNIPINNSSESNMYNGNGVNKSKKSIVIIVSIIVLVILLIPITIGIVLVISTKKVNSQISDARINSFVEEYQMLKKQVRINMVQEDNVVCYDDCEDYYDVDSKKYFFEVTDKGEFYELNFEVNKDLYNDFEFTNESCSYLSDSICDKNKITGKVYKD